MRMAGRFGRQTGDVFPKGQWKMRGNMGNSAKLYFACVHAPWILGRGARIVAQDLLFNVRGCVSFYSSLLRQGIWSQLFSKFIFSPGLNECELSK